MSTEEMTPGFARQVGERLRNIRRQQRLSLQAVEGASAREFKASVLGAYERGERIISVLRLSRYLSMIQLQRGDFNRRVLTIRDEDVRALARLFQRDPDAMRGLMEQLGIRK